MKFTSVLVTTLLFNIINALPTPAAKNERAITGEAGEANTDLFFFYPEENETKAVKRAVTGQDGEANTDLFFIYPEEGAKKTMRRATAGDTGEANTDLFFIYPEEGRR